MIFKKITDYRFPLWIAVFSFLLISIPFSVMVLDNLFLAKFFGATLVILLLFALRFWFSVARNRNNIVPRVVLNKNDLFDLNKDFKAFKGVSSADQDIILNRIGILLSKVKFVDGDDELLDRREAIKTAYVYVCENWTDDFIVNTNWIFSLTKAASANTSNYEFTVSLDSFEQKRAHTIPVKG